jgi:hypothetical protein
VRFHTEFAEELQRIALGPLSARAPRNQEPEAIWPALAEFGLLTRTQGGRFDLGS